MVWYGMVWYGMVWCGMVWCGMVWYGMVWWGVVWYGMVWYGMVWYSTAEPVVEAASLRIVYWVVRTILKVCCKFLNLIKIRFF
jgi:hypothetical protein